MRGQGAKERWMTEKCEDMEAFEHKYDMHSLHKRVKQLKGYVKKTSNTLVDKTGKLIVDQQKGIKEWVMYMKELFFDNIINLINNHNNDEGPIILENEAQQSIKGLKNNKAPGPYQIYPEPLKHIDEDNIGNIVKLFNKMYD